jgi:hypothetical protein
MALALQGPPEALGSDARRAGGRAEGGATALVDVMRARHPEFSWEVVDERTFPQTFPRRANQ